MSLPSISRKPAPGSFFYIFNWHDELARGRICLLLNVIITTIVNDLVSGTLYTAFLTINNFSIGDVGIISYLPLLGSCFSLFSPIFLERFSRRRWILAGGRFLYITINILGLTFLPLYVKDATAKLVLFGIVVFLGSAINGLISSGWTVWHLNFMPDEVRAKYLSYQQIFTTIFSTTILLISGAIADVLRGTPHEAGALIAMRLFGYGLSVIEILILMIPREYPYPHKAHARLTNIFRLPFQCRKFMYTMGIVALWNFASRLTASSSTYYLLNTAQVSITLMNVLTMGYGLFLFLLTPLWWRVLSRFSWFTTFAIAAIVTVPTVFGQAFITADNAIWLYPFTRIFAHTSAVGLNLSFSNFPYVNTPKEDQTCYISFYMLLTNLIGFFAQFCATAFIHAIDTATFTVFDMPLCAAQLLFLFQGILFMLCALLVLRFRRSLAPDTAP